MRHMLWIDRAQWCGLTVCLQLYARPRQLSARFAAAYAIMASSRCTAARSGTFTFFQARGNFATDDRERVVALGRMTWERLHMSQIQVSWWSTEPGVRKRNIPLRFAEPCGRANIAYVIWPTSPATSSCNRWLSKYGIWHKVSVGCELGSDTWLS